MAGSTETVLGAGTKLSYEDPQTPDIFILLEEALKIGSTGEQGTFVQDTPIVKTTHRYKPGMKDTPDKEFVLNDVPGNAEQEAFLQLANERKSVRMKVELLNGRTGTFTVVLGGYMVNEPESEGVVTVTVYGKQSGATEWTVA